MSFLHRVGSFWEKSFAREAANYSFTFTGSSGAAGTLEQDEGVVASVAYTSAGLYAVTLACAFLKLRFLGQPNIRLVASGGFTAMVTDVVEGGAAANTFNVRVFNASDAAADPGAMIEVSFRAITAKGSGRSTS